MNIEDKSSVNGVLVAAELQEIIQQLSSDLTTDERQTQREARRSELTEGLRAARQMHEKADAVRSGAVIGGVITLASAAGQFDAVTEFETCSKEVAQADFGKFETAGKMGDYVNRLFSAEGDDAEARSQGADTRSKAASHQADEAEASLRDIGKVEDSAKDLYLEIARTQHASMMAVLARQ